MANNLIFGEVSNGFASPTSLQDNLGRFITDNVVAGMLVANATDGSYATIISVDSNTSITTSPLQGGDDNNWRLGNEYVIYLDGILIDSSINFKYTVSDDFVWCTRVIDARWHSRARMYETQRHGVYALYKNAYPSGYRDEYNMTGSTVEDHELVRIGNNVPISQFNKENPLVQNTGLLYGPTQKIRLMYFSPTEKTVEAPWGLTVGGTAVVSAPLSYPFRRGDLFKIHDKTWMIAEKPEFEYNRGREIIGYQLTLVGLKVAQIDW
jgi:hypothetical protein